MPTGRRPTRPREWRRKTSQEPRRDPSPLPQTKRRGHGRGAVEVARAQATTESSDGPTSWVRLLTAVEERPPLQGGHGEERNDCRIMVEVKKHEKGGQAQVIWSWLGLLQRPRKVHMRQLLHKSSATRALGLSKHCAPRRLAPTSLLLNGTLPCANTGSWFIQPHKGGVLDSDIRVSSRRNSSLTQATAV